MDFRLEQGFIWCEMWSLTLWMTFCVSVPMIWGIWAQFSQLAQFSRHTKTGITRTADGIYTWIRLPLMWSVEFYTFDDFLYIDAHDLGYLSLIYLTCPNSTDTQNRYKLTFRLPLHLSKASFDVKCGVKHFELHAHDLGFSVPISLICPNAPKLE